MEGIPSGEHSGEITWALGKTDGAWMSESFKGGVKAGETPGNYPNIGGLLHHK